MSTTSNTTIFIPTIVLHLRPPISSTVTEPTLLSPRFPPLSEPPAPPFVVGTGLTEQFVPAPPPPPPPVPALPLFWLFPSLIASFRFAISIADTHTSSGPNGCVLSIRVTHRDPFDATRRFRDRRDNGIVDYLLTSQSHPKHTSHFADERFTPEQQRQSRWCTGLLRNELDTVLCCLRYASTEAWRDVHRPRAVRASVDPNGRLDLRRLSQMDAATAEQHNEQGLWERFYRSEREGTDNDDDDGDTVGSGIFHASAWFQAWSERAVHKKRLALSNPYHLFPQGRGEVDIGRALDLAKDSYDVIESMLVETTSSEQTYDDPNHKNGTDGVDGIVYRLIGTEKPSLTETILFEHLAEALCDLNLVSVLKDYPRLVGFFQSTYRTYFGTSYIQRYQPPQQSTADTASKDNEHNSWIRHNNRYNLLNRFHRLPVIPPSRHLPPPRTDTGQPNGTNGTPQPTSSSSPTAINYDEVVPIIRSLAVHCRDYRQLLVDVAALRDEERVLRDKHCSEGGEPWGMWNRWRMGGSMSPKDDQNNTNNDGDNGKNRKGTDASGEGGGGRGDRDDGTDAFTKRNQKHVRDLKREAKTQDELWISGVTVGTLFGLVLAVAKSSSVAVENS